MKKNIRLSVRVFSVSAILASLVFGWLWWKRFNLSYNSEGKFFDPATSVTYEEDAYLTFSVLALGLFATGFFSYASTLIKNPKANDLKSEW